MISLKECIDKLDSELEADRIYAAEDIGDANQIEGVGPLISRLPIEGSRAVREAIVSALLEMDHECVIVGVLRWLDSEDPFVRNQAVEIIRKRGAKAIPHLEAAFRCGKNDRRKFVVDVLIKVTDSSASGIYRLALSDPDLNVVIAAVESLGASRRIQFRQHIEDKITVGAHPMLVCACLEALAHMAEPASVNAVRSRLGEIARLPGYIRPFYLRLLGAAGNLEDAGEIAEALSVQELQATALNALTALRNRYPHMELSGVVADHLMGIAAGRQPMLIRYEALRLLSAAAERSKIITFLEHCLELPDKVTRIGAIQSLHEMRSEETDAIVRRFLATETDEDVLEAASIREV